MLVGPTSTARLTTQHSSSSALSASSSFADSSSRAVSSGASIWIRTACYCVASLTFHFTGTPSGCSTTITTTCMASLPCRQLPSTPPSSARSFARSLRSSITRRVAHARTQRIACLLPVVHARSQRIASCSALHARASSRHEHTSHHATSTRFVPAVWVQGNAHKARSFHSQSCVHAAPPLPLLLVDSPFRSMWTVRARCQHTYVNCCAGQMSIAAPVVSLT